MASYPYEKITSDLLEDFDSRTRDIIGKRFGLTIEEPLTLERIGQEHSITRERVRQIVDEAITKLKETIKQKETKPVLLKIFSHFSDALKKLGNAKREDLLLEKLQGRSHPNYIMFLLQLDDQFLRHRETPELHSFWTSERELFHHLPRLLHDMQSYFEKAKHAAHFDELQEIYDTSSQLALSSLLEISKRIVQAHDGRWGLSEWPSVNPRTIRDKAYIALQYEGTPLHFRDVAKTIEELQEKFPGNNEKTVLSQTVHNELIKDPRFVLVGRGIYALGEWGYRQGTVKDVLVAILRDSKTPLSKEEILQQIISQRQVKETTIVLNLQDRSLFARDASGRYYVK